MGVESPDTIYDLNRNWPEGPVDSRREGDNHLRNLKGALLDTFLVDEIANRPTAGTENRLFISTDERKFYRDTGIAWEEIPDLSAYALASELNTAESDIDALEAWRTALEQSVASVYRSTDQSVSEATWTKVAFNVERVDVGSNHSSGTYTVPSTGTYLVTAGVHTTSDNLVRVAMYVSGNRRHRFSDMDLGGGPVAPLYSGAALWKAGAGDTFSIYVWGESGGGLGIKGGDENTWMTIARVL